MRALILKSVISISTLLLFITNPNSICLADSSLTPPYNMKPANIKPLVHDVLEQGVRLHFSRLENFKLNFTCNEKNVIIEMGTVDFKGHPYIWTAITNFNVHKQEWKQPSISAQSVISKQPIYVKVVKPIESKLAFVVGCVVNQNIQSAVISISRANGFERENIPAAVLNNSFCFKIPSENLETFRLGISDHKIVNGTLLIEAKTLEPVKNPIRIHVSQSNS